MHVGEWEANQYTAGVDAQMNRVVHWMYMKQTATNVRKAKYTMWTNTRDVKNPTERALPLSAQGPRPNVSQTFASTDLE